LTGRAAPAAARADVLRNVRLENEFIALTVEGEAEAKRSTREARKLKR
jgi:hypothetical protein